MNVLFIVMEFVPLNIAGVYRPLRFVNALKRNGINPVVVTFDVTDNLRKVQSKFDDELMKRVSPDVQIVRIPLDDVTSFTSTKWKRFRNIYFNLTDNFYKAWKRNFYAVIQDVVAKHNPLVVITTCPPYSAALFGEEVSKRFGIPLVIDMRDAWAKLSINPVGSIFHYYFKKRLERRVFKHASAIVTVTPQLKKIFERTHPNIKESKFHLVYNSPNYEIRQAEVCESRPLRDTSIIQIGYTGYFYFDPKARETLRKPWYRKRLHRALQYVPVNEDWMYRSPYFFFLALSILFERRPDLRTRIRFNHIGQTPDWLPKMVDDFCLGENVVLHGYQSQEKVLELENSFDYLLATSEKVIGDEHYCLPSKLFTYILSSKPVLGFVTQGIQSDFIVNSGIGVVLDPDDSNKAATKLEELILNGFSSNINQEYLERFSSIATSDKFTEIVRDVYNMKSR